MDGVSKNELFIATVSIKQKTVDRLKTALRFWLNSTRISARMTSKTTTFVTSISAIVMERYVNEKSDEKKMILQRNALSERRYRSFRLRSDSRTSPIVKINKMAVGGAPRLRVNEVVFW